jgi:VWFA-related protein
MRGLFPSLISRSFALATALISVRAALPAQTTPSTAYTQDGSIGVRLGDSAHPHELVSISIPPMANAPFSLTLDTTWKPPQGAVRRLNTNSEHNSRRIMRDSAGRIYEERWTFVQDPQPDNAGFNTPAPIAPTSVETYIQISDPVAHIYFNCSVTEKVCTLTQYKGSTEITYRPEVAANKKLADGSAETTQRLGDRNVGGFKTEGYRVTTTYNDGSSANGPRFVSGREFWYSPQLGIDLISQVSSPAAGEQQFSVAKLTTTAPDPKYFTPPVGYRIVDQRQSTSPDWQTAAAQPATLPQPLQSAPATAPPPPTPPNPNHPVATIQTTARLVVLDVVVTDKQGHPAKGLKQSDFTLYEDGGPQKLASFTEHDAASEASPHAPESHLPPNTFTDHAPVTNSVAMTVIVFDTASLAWQDAVYARDQVAEYMKKVTPGTPICIFKLDASGLQLLQDFSTDPQLLRQAVESKRNEQLPRRSGPMLIRRGVAVRELARYLSSFPGRKNLIWFGGSIGAGFDVPQLQPGLGFPNPSGVLFNDVDSFSQDLHDATDTLTLSRVALYTVDPRGVVFSKGEQLDILQQGGDLSEVASATGDKAFYNSNAIEKDVAEVVAIGSHYYTLSYTPTDTHWDGSFRNIEVQLKPPLHLAYRDGYYARPNAPRRTPGSEAPGMRRLISYSAKGDPNAITNSTSLDEAMAFGAVPPFQVLFKAQVTPTPSTEKLERNAPLPQDNYLGVQWRRSPYRDYQIHYSVNPRDIQFTPGKAGSYHASIELLAVVYNEYGAQVNSLVATIPLNVNANDFDRILQSGLGINQTIAIPVHGDFYLRLGVHDLTSNRVSALEVPSESIKLTPQNLASNPPATH